MDEPIAERTSSARFRSSGDSHQRIGIIYISHYLEEVFSIADRITVLRRSRHLLQSGGRGQQCAIVHAMVGTTLPFYQRERLPIGRLF